MRKERPQKRRAQAMNESCGSEAVQAQDEAWVPDPNRIASSWLAGRDRPTRPRGRHGAKSDALDAIRAGREALARDHLTTPRQRGHREAIRVLHTTRAAIVQAGADARRQLKALIVTAPEPLRDRLRGRPWRQQVAACAALLAMPSDPVEHRATVRALALTVQRILTA